MQKIKIGICVLACILGLAGCSQNKNADSIGSSQPENKSGVTERENGDEGSAKNAQTDENHGTNGNLQILSLSDKSYCSNENGFYYRTEFAEELKDGIYGYHMMYMDYATRQEVYLCSNAGCSHDTLDCTSVFSDDEVGFDSIPFFYGDALYLLSKEYDDDGTTIVEANFGEVSTGAAESMPAALYRMNPDGTGRTKVFEFSPDVTVEDVVLGDDTNLYFITKELTSEQSENSTYITSSKRNLIKVDKESWKESVVCSMDFTQDKIEDKWKIDGVFDSCLVLENTLYKSEASWQELNEDDDLWKERYSNSEKEFATYDLSNGSFQVVYTISNKDLNVCLQKGNMLYVSNKDSGKIRQVDLTTGEESKFAELDCSYIVDTYNDVLCCWSWDNEKDKTLYFIRYDSGEISHCGLVNKKTGWNLEIKAETKDYFLVVYDYDAIDNGDGSYEILQYKHALITKEDLYQGRGDFLPIQMIGKGV